MHLRQLEELSVDLSASADFCNNKAKYLGVIHISIQQLGLQLDCLEEIHRQVFAEHFQIPEEWFEAKVSIKYEPATRIVKFWRHSR